MSYTTRPVLLKNRIKNDGTYPINIRVTVAREQTYIPVKKYAPEAEWDEANNKLKARSKFVNNVTRFNNQILSKHNWVDDICSQLDEHDLINSLTIIEIRAFTLWCEGKDDEEIKDAITQLKEGLTVTELIASFDKSTDEKIDVYKYLEKVIKQLKKAKRDGYAQDHDNLLTKLKSFHGKKKLRFEDITFTFLNDLEAEHLGEGHKLGGLGVYLRTLRARYNDAIKEGVVKEKYYPFNKYTIKKGTPRRVALSDASFDEFIDFELVPGSPEHRTRALFMSSYYLRGINWMDMAYFQVKQINKEFTRCSYIRRKTGKKYNIAIHPKLKELLIEFLGDNFDPETLVFPILNPDDEGNLHDIIKERRNNANKILKKIGKQIGCPGLTFYSARHTYATRSKRKGVPTNAIQDALGHSTEQTTQVYLESFEDEIIDGYDDMVFSD